MAELKKNIDKGIAYLKKNGARAAAVRLCRKVYLSRETNYGKWLQDQRKRRAKTLPPVNADHIKIVISGKLPEPIRAEDFFLFIEEGDHLEKDARQVYADALLKYPGAELLYCDSDWISGDGRSYQDPQCKPDFDEYYLQSTNYIGGGFLVSGRLVKELGAPVQLYDYLWRCIERTESVLHVPEILYHRAEKKEDMEMRQETDALRKHFDRGGVSAAVLPGLQPWTRKIIYRYGEKPRVSILIPNKDHREDLEKCIGSIRKFAGYEPYEILIIENNSTSEEIFSFYAEIQKKEKNVRVITYEGDFNFSKINNFGAKKAKGEYLLFLNNDTEMTTEGCLREMMNYAQRPDVGAVGAQLLYGDGTIQHAGVIVGYGGVAGHAFEGMPRQQALEITPIICSRSYSAVTAACMLVRRSLFEKLGGFDERLGVAYNDIDLCLRIGASGEKVIYTPYAQLFHYESRTRGLELTQEKAKRVKRETEVFQKRWSALLEKGDPCYNPNLTLEKPDFSLRR
ncbi:MAG: glycosyltransferase family 2 protein [Lachnospiraceae bacterium]|nr:glycosyltransferase family 2 protein [Lachnospiraceae bacterium]